MLKKPQTKAIGTLSCSPDFECRGGGGGGVVNHGHWGR